MALTDNCQVQFGISNVCGDLLQVSGMDKDFYVGYVSDLGTRFSLLQTDVISAIHFTAYNGLIKFSSQKFSHVASYDLQKGGGGALSYLHRFAARMMNLSTRDDVEVQRLTQAQDAFIVCQDNNEDFFIYGPSKGLSAVAGPLRTSGQNSGEDISTLVTLEGAEKVLPLRFDAGSTTATVALLDSYVV